MTFNYEFCFRIIRRFGRPGGCICATFIVAVLSFGVVTASDCSAGESRPGLAFVGKGYLDSPTVANSANDEIKKSSLNLVAVARSIDVAGVASTLDADPNAKVPPPQRAPLLTETDVDGADVVLTMTARQKESVIARYRRASSKTFTLAEYTTGKPLDFEDIAGRPLNSPGVAAELAKYLVNLRPMITTAIQKVAQARN